MNKNDFRSLCNVLAVGDTLSLSAIDTPLDTSAVVEAISTGRGRGGSKLLRVMLANGETRQYSSSHSNHLICVERAGQMYGSQSNANIFGPNQNATSAQAREIGARVTSAFKNVLALKNTGNAVNIYFQVPQNHTLHGEWSVQSGRLVRGRGGQCALVLTNAKNDLVEVWSRRIVGEVDAVKYVDSNGFTEVVDCQTSQAQPCEQPNQAAGQAV